MWRYRGKKRAAILTALSLYLLSGTGTVSAEDINVNKPGRAATGIEMKEDADKTYNEDLNVNVLGSSGGWKNEVTGISLKTGAQMTVESIHAGLETSWHAAKNPELDIVSIGVTTTGIHTPAERVEVATIVPEAKLLMGTLRRIAQEEA